MSDYFLTTRNIRNPRHGQPYFGSEHSHPVYLECPETARTLDPDDRIKGANAGIRWAQKIVKSAQACGDDAHIVVFVHGYNHDPQETLIEHRLLKRRLLAAGLTNAVFVTYAWPSMGSFLNYLEDDLDAKKAALDLVASGLALFAKFSEPGCRLKVHVVAHSMGCMVVREALAAATGHVATREAAWGITNLVFYAADISQRSLKRESGHALLKNSQRFTNYFNREDTVLATANVKRFLTARRLGRHGAPAELRDKIVDIDMTDHWLQISADNDEGVIFDVPASHAFYRYDDVFIQDLATTLQGDKDRRMIANRQFFSKDKPLKLMATENS